MIKNAEKTAPMEWFKILPNQEVMNSKLPELVKGKTGMTKSGEVEIWYEVMGVKNCSQYLDHSYPKLIKMAKIFIFG